MGKSSDRQGEAAVIVYVDENGSAHVPASIEGVRTLVIATNAHAVALGTAPLANPASGAMPVSAAELGTAAAVKRQVVKGLMRSSPGIFGVGVGQSLDNPREAALVVYVDRKQMPAHLAQSVDGLRTRYIVMDRLHVTRSYATTVGSTRHCLPHPSGEVDPNGLVRPIPLKLF
jgi:hypothetical protein